MCGRFVLWITLSLADHYDLADSDISIPASYNIAPGQDIVAVVGQSTGRKLVRFQWGFIPSWTKDVIKSPRSINARSETVWEKPSFRSAIRSRRCLIPANGFLEWKKSGARKQPFLVRFENLELFSMVGIWESWKNPKTSEIIDSCAILTTSANEVVATIHDRMPVIIKPEDYSTWLSPESRREQIDVMLQPYADTPTHIQPVSTRVNSPKNNDPDCIVPVLLPDENQG
ncbi:SOS response-associated peptidase [Desulfonatronum thioautotrophicum]|uniref:SOS response-associated peptidase n=1 Tax=Desulfonatronum thioautotrophicum TaxID=617001 RepID=UPI0005EB15A2|nr:SOS response-associated peptidase [Desulfonatronum thioautotrophicum]